VIILLEGPFPEFFLGLTAFFTVVSAVHYLYFGSKQLM